MNTLNQRLLITIGFYIVVIVVGALFVIRPLMAKVQTNQTQLQVEYQKYLGLQTRLKQLTLLQQNKDSIQQASATANLAIPATLQEDTLTLVLEKIVTEGKLTLGSLNQSTNKTQAAATSKSPTGQKTAGLASVTYTVVASGKYEDILQLLTKLEGLDRLLTVDNVTVSSTTSGSTTGAVITASIQLDGFGQKDTP